MADQDSSDIEEDSDNSPDESQRQVSVDAASNHCCEKPTAKKKSGTAEGDPAPTRGLLKQLIASARLVTADFGVDLCSTPIGSNQKFERYRVGRARQIGFGSLHMKSETVTPCRSDGEFEIHAVYRTLE